MPSAAAGCSLLSRARPPPAGSRRRAFSSRRFDGMALEGTRFGAKLAELVADHLFGHIHGNKFFAVVATGRWCDQSCPATIVERRRPGLSPLSFRWRVFQCFHFCPRKWPSTKGPFFVERANRFLIPPTRRKTPPTGRAASS